MVEIMSDVKERDPKG